jgi:hypothetical protein
MPGSRLEWNIFGKEIKLAMFTLKILAHNFRSGRGNLQQQTIRRPDN